MSSLTYCKGLPTPIEEMNETGHTHFEMFLNSFATIFHKAVCKTVNHLLSNSNFNKSKWNTHLQQTYQINKRHANGVISFAKGKVDSTKECHQLHIRTIKGKLKSLESWTTKAENKLKLAQKLSAKKNWQSSKTVCNFPLATYLDSKTTNWQSLKFHIHNKKRLAYLLKNKLEHLQNKVIQVKVPKDHVFTVGSKDETLGNQVCQWDGNIIKFRVPACLESKFGSHISTNIGSFDRNLNRLPENGSKTWHFYRKNGKWVVAVKFTPAPVKRVSRYSAYSCIGIDLNPGSIGWSYVDLHGNLKHHGQIPLQMGLPKGKQDAQIADACLQLAILADTFVCPIVCEELDFSDKKEQLKEKGKKYARMLSSWAYKRFYDLLKSILSNRGIYLMQVNPAYTSLIGLVKYARQYALASDEAAALAIARRGMRLSENIPDSITAYLSVKEGKHVWSLWNQLNTIYKQSRINRHQVYSISNWEFLVKQANEASSCSSSKRKR